MSGYPRVAGKCPACLSAGTLFLGDGGHVTCSLIGCPRPCDVDDLLHDRIAMGIGLDAMRAAEART